MWAENSVFYQIYPLGFCGAPHDNDGVTVPRIRKVIEWIPHLKSLNVDAVYFSPVFESDRHGYDTRDYRKLDVRLGTDDDFADVCAALKENGIKVVLDGVFNHVGRGFWAFRDVMRHRWDSRYKDWFHISFDGNSGYNDGFRYEGWEGHFELVKLNLLNPEVTDYLFDCIRYWVERFDIDGLRLDVAYCLNEQFLRQIRGFCNTVKPDFFLVGEVLFGDYRRIMNGDMLHSCTNYECYKGLYSSFNDMNLFELAHTLNRQFGRDPYSLYRGAHMMSFADNHDVTRVASILNNKRHLPLLYGLLFGLPGIPCIYYGSEWGAEGDKHRGDDALRPSFDAPERNELTELISSLAAIHKRYKSLTHGEYQSVVLTNRQFVFERECDGERIWIAVNADDSEFYTDFGGRAPSDEVTELLTGEKVRLNGGFTLAPYGLYYWKVS